MQFASIQYVKKIPSLLLLLLLPCYLSVISLLLLLLLPCYFSCYFWDIFQAFQTAFFYNL